MRGEHLPLAYSSEMTDEFDSETQWTPAASEALSAKGEQLLLALRDHISLTLGRSGRANEDVDYIASSEALRRAAAAFDDAEFDWCGSSPLGLEMEDWDEDDDQDEPPEKFEHGVLSVIGRWDYRVLDEQLLISAGRVAYSTAWPEDTNEDAVLRVDDPISAVHEIAHVHGWHGLEQVAGIEAVASMTDVILHEDEGDSWLDSDEDPFAIARQS